LSDDSAVASDHLPVKMVFNLPYRRPFRIRSASEANAVIHLVWDSDPGDVYMVESTTNLSDTNGWATVQTGFMATNEISELDVQVTVSSGRFFRIVGQ